LPVAEWLSGNRAVDPHDHRPLGRACGFLVGPQLRGERVPVENDGIEAESQPARALRRGDRAGQRADQDLRPSCLHRLRADLGRRDLVEPALVLNRVLPPGGLQRRDEVLESVAAAAHGDSRGLELLG
jgi:hypothetical protein